VTVFYYVFLVRDIGDTFGDD